MSFNSPEFLVFFPIVLLLYVGVLHRERLREWLLLFASYAFYMSWNWKYGGLLAFSTIIDYSVGRALVHEKRPHVRKAILILSLCSNLGLLGIFKYYNFFVDLTVPAASLFGLDLSFLRHELILPVGISFYTFQTMSYTIDLYRREEVLEKDLLKFSVFVAFFPQLVAGPIVRAKQFLPQLRRGPIMDQERFHHGLLLVFRGLFKKIAIADLLGTLAVDKIFSAPLTFSSWDLLMGLYAYAFQIYNDFSGYSDIAIGLAKMLGFELPKNFNRPYLSQNAREFWTRWHITLSTWLRDYLYISLGGNRGSPWRVRLNLMLTMLLGGLWHGAALHFVAWGGYHGLLLILARSTPKIPPPQKLWVKVGQQIQCFHLIVFGWLLFRAQDMNGLLEYMRGLARLSSGTALHPLFYSILGTAVLLHVIPVIRLQSLESRFLSLPVPALACVYAVLLMVYCGLTVESPKFIYFQF